MEAERHVGLDALVQKIRSCPNFAGDGEHGLGGAREQLVGRDPFSLAEIVPGLLLQCLNPFFGHGIVAATSQEDVGPKKGQIAFENLGDFQSHH